jgi:hypothetical protein
MSDRRGSFLPDDFLTDVTPTTDGKKHKHRHRHHDQPSTPTPPAISSTIAYLAPTTSATESRLRASGASASYHLTNILHFLEQRATDGKPAVTEEEISREIGTDLRSVPKLLRALQNNPHVLFEDSLYQWRGSLDTLISDRNQLEDVLKQVRSLTTSDLKGSYKSIDKDLKQLEEDGIIGVFPASNPREKLYFYYDPDLKAKKAPAEFRGLWEKTQVPASEKAREEGLRKFAAEPLVVVPQFPSQEDDIGVVQKRRTRGRQKFMNELLMVPPA